MRFVCFFRVYFQSQIKVLQGCNEFKIKMISQQDQILAEFEKVRIKQQNLPEKQQKVQVISSSRGQQHGIKQNLSISRTKFDIKKFEQNILKQILSKNQGSNTKNPASNQKQNRSSLSHANSFKQITNQRKLSRNKSKSKQDLHFNKINNQAQLFNKAHMNNTKILRQKLLNAMSTFDDYQMINIEDSIPILNQARILKILTSLEQTKSKIQSKQLPEGRVKEEAKFIYFLWKMIDEEMITTRHLKEVILLLNELNKNDLMDTLGDLYCRQGEIVKMFVECWMKLKLDKFFYEASLSKQKNITQNRLESSKKLNQKISSDQKTIKKLERCKTQHYDAKNSEPYVNQETFNQIKFLHPQEQKQLIERLYQERKDFINRRQKVKTLHEEQKQNQELKKCTFKPVLTSSPYQKLTSKTNHMINSKVPINKEIGHQDSLEKQLEKRYQSKQNSKSKVKGFQKAIKRMKNGHSQTKLKQQLLAYHSVGQNYQKIKQKPMNPPKFLQRQKEKKEEMILFVIQFQIGRHKVKVKIHPTDTQMSVSKKISKIYGLKPEEEEEIREIVSMELNNYYKKIEEDVSEFFDN